MMKGRAGPPSLPPPTPPLIQLQNMCVLHTTQGVGGGGGWPSQPLKGQVSRGFFVTFLFLSPSGTGKQKLQNKTEENPSQKNKNAPPGNPVYSIPK